jgi:hypothetical protein
MHSFRHGEHETWGLTAETLVRLCVLACPSHPFPYPVNHPDGLCMEGWMGRVVALQEFRAEAERVARRYGNGGGNGGGRGSSSKGKKKKEEEDDEEEEGQQEAGGNDDEGGAEAAAAAAAAARERRRALKGGSRKEG